MPNEYTEIDDDNGTTISLGDILSVTTNKTTAIGLVTKSGNDYFVVIGDEKIDLSALKYFTKHFEVITEE